MLIYEKIIPHISTNMKDIGKREIIVFHQSAQFQDQKNLMTEIIFCRSTKYFSMNKRIRLLFVFVYQAKKAPASKWSSKVKIGFLSICECFIITNICIYEAMTQRHHCFITLFNNQVMSQTPNVSLLADFLIFILSYS